MKRIVLLLALLVVVGCAMAPAGTDVSPAARVELAPTGTLRVGLIAVNPLFVTQNTPPGITKGIAVDIANRLASRLGVPMTPVLYPSIGALMESTRKGEWDITFLPVNPERAALMNFTAPYMYTESTFLVSADSTAKGIADLDRPGKTIVAVGRSTQDVWLRANMRVATLVAASTPAAALQMLKEGKVDAYGSNASALAEASLKIPGSRLLPGSFDDVPIALAVIKARPAADAFAYEFIDQLKASGAIQEVIEREKLAGVRVAK
ncbi:MAG: transporter substrate-binding domain-containing protein [Burkholderiales bacterium]|nr:transporter substrate-binding domain-containing protein [Burkholderiales bacterium]